jgi:hypothetical protein
MDFPPSQLDCILGTMRVENPLPPAQLYGNNTIQPNIRLTSSAVPYVALIAFILQNRGAKNKVCIFGYAAGNQLLIC